MIEPLRRVLVKRPDEVFAGADPRTWHYAGKPDLDVARREHEAFVILLAEAGAEVIYHDELQPDCADAIFVHDPAIVTDEGAVILQMGKALRRGEEKAMAARFESLGIPILSRLTGSARAEGGDLMWVDHDTLAVGVGARTNREGLRQLAAALLRLRVSIIPVELPPQEDPAGCLHLMSLVSMVDDHLVVIYPKLFPPDLSHFLEKRGFRFVHCAPGEFDTMGTNVLALSPGKCVMLEGNPVTRRRLEEAGCEVRSYRGNEISMQAEGGPTCLTRPILRDAVEG